MIAPNRPGELSPILSPQLGKRSPVRPGESIPVRLPLRAMSGTDMRDEIVVRFHAEAATCQPETVRLGVLRSGESVIAETKAIVSPLNGKRNVRVWAEVTIGARTLESTAAEIKIEARSDLRIAAEDDGSELRVQLFNNGDAPTEVRIEALGSAVPTSTDVTFHEDREGRCISNPFTMGVGEERIFLLTGARVDHLIAVADDGERVSTQPIRNVTLPSAELIPTFTIDALPSGVRLGDLVRFTLDIDNPTGCVIEELFVTLNHMSEMKVLEDTLTIDGGRIIDEDIDRSSAEQLGLRAGRISPHGTVTLAGTYSVTLTNPREIDALLITGSITAKDSASYRFEAEAMVDRRPAFAAASTFLSEIGSNNKGAYRIHGAVTNSEAVAYERVRVRLDIVDANPLDFAMVGKRKTPLRPTALDAGSALFIDLGKLEPGARRTFSLELSPTRGDNSARVMRVKALLYVDDHIVPLGASEYRVPGLPDLQKSALQRRDARPLRLGMPCEATLSIRNDGTAPARDVRMSLDLPSYIGASAPEPEDGTRWRKIATMLPPGGAVATTLTFYLTEPPQTTSATILAKIDAESHGALVVGELVFETPTDPLIDPPALQSQPLDDGRIAYLARVVNHGDGKAEDIALRVLDPEYIMPRTTTVDGLPREDVGPRSILATSLSLGTIGPGEYRDIMWTAAPPNDEPYRTTVALTYKDGPEQTSTSVPTRARFVAALSHTLPEPRRLVGGVTDERAPRRPTVTKLSDHRKTAIGTNKALSDAQGTTQASLPLSIEPKIEIKTDQAPSTNADAAPTYEQPKPRQGSSDASAPTMPASTDRPTETSLLATTVQDDDGIASSKSDGQEQEKASSQDATASGNDAADDDIFGTMQIVDATAAKPPIDDTSPTVSPAMDYALPRLSLTPMALSSALTMADQLIEAPLSWWRHTMMVRLLIAENFPLEELATEVSELRNLLTQPIKSAFPKLFADDFAVSNEFINHLSQNDEAAAAILARLAERYPVLTPKPQIRTTGAALDSALPNLMCDAISTPDAEPALGDYKEVLTRTYNYVSVLNLADENARREKYGAMPNATLDESLRVFLTAARTKR